MNSHTGNRRDDSCIKAFFLSKLPSAMNPGKEQEFIAITREKK